jgi:bleomycin hydrolase
MTAPRTDPGTSDPQPLSAADIELLAKEFDADPASRRAQNAVTQVSIDDVALDRRIVTSIDPSVSHLLDDWKVTNQKKSGRCWLFAGLNLLRPGAMKLLGVKDFEFSQNHIMFFDKLERANYFLSSVIATADREPDDRTLAYVFDAVAGDGGQWNMFVALVRKHGLVPKNAMPETESSSNTAKMNAVLRTVLRQGARDLRQLDPAARAERKREILSAVYRVLSIHLGTPPERFLWQYADDNHEFHREGWLTPVQFAEKYVTVDLADYVCLVDDPRPTSPKNRTFTVDQLGNVVGGDPVVYLNVDMAVIKDAAMRTIVGGQPVWFGCDVGKMMRRDIGIWDARLFDLAGVYGVDFDMTKAERLIYHETQMTHAMLFTGVDVVDDAPRRWRVENSWGDENGAKGFYTMNDSWFDEYVFEIACRRDLLAPELLEALDSEPIMLPAWDPMGALAR